MCIHCINSVLYICLTRSRNAGVSCTVTISDQRSYIKIETLHSKNSTKIHSALSEVCGEFMVAIVWFLVELIFFVVVV